MTDIQTQLKGMSTEEKRALAAQLLKKRLGGAKTVHPQSFGQQNWWYMTLMQPDSMALNVPCPLRIVSRVDVEALRRSFQTIVDRHAALRTTFTMLAGEPMQEVHAQAEVAFEHVDASGWSDDELRARVNAAHLVPFDIERGPILRVTLFSRSDTDHVLFPVVHHIAFDGLSLGLLLEELRQIYEAEVAGRPHGLPPQKEQYTDFLAWQSEMLESPEGQRHREYWLEQLSGTLPQLGLPTDRPRVPNKEFLPARYEFPLDDQLTASLRALARDQRTTLYTVLLSAFYVQLHRYTGQEEIVVGSPMGGRTRPEFESIIGCFSNLVLLRAYPRADMPFSELLKDVRQIVLDAIDHQDYPNALIVPELRKQGSHRDSLFDIAFNIQRLGRFGGFLETMDPTVQRSTVAGLEIERFDLDQAEEGTDIFLNLLETERTMVYRFRYNPDIFDRATIVRMGEHIENLLRGIVDNPDQTLGELPLLTEAERQRVLVEWNATEADYPRDARIHELFEAQVERTPDAIALIAGGEIPTYRQINEAANQVANHLLRLGVTPETPIGVCLRRTPAMVTALLGVLKAGAAYLPLDPAYPMERLAFMLRDTQAPIILTEASLVGLLPESSAQVVSLDSDWATIAAESPENPAVPLPAESVAYILYTSGSTGQPKGVLGLHRGAMNRFTWMWNTFPFQAGEVCCLTTTLSFVDAVWEVFGPLLRGVPVVLIPEETVLDLGQLIGSLATNRVSRFVLVPSLLDAILEAEPRLQDRLPNLRLWTCSGEALPVELLRRFRAAMPNATMLNLYGSSEVAADVTYCDISTLDLETVGSVPIGRPIANTQIYLLDPDGRPVPIGVPGEMYVGGANLARGYFQRPDLTKERFVQSPFCTDPEARLFRTGDRARYLNDGTIEYIGRVDNQVKIRGARVEPGEVETVLAGHPELREAVVAAREDRSGAQRLIAYYVPAEGTVPGTPELRAFLRDRLPEYMVPTAYVSLDAMPRTPNGKLDRRALPAPQQERVEEFQAPTTPMEIVIAEVWREALEIERVGVYDNFFDLGGHSLLAMRVIARLQQRTGIRLNPGLLQTQTLGQVATMYQAMERRQAPTPAPSKPQGVAGQMFQAVRRFVGPRQRDRR
jgi:amino acid adenylation domain-containing protein